jgi:hypothetical protein
MDLGWYWREVHEASTFLSVFTHDGPILVEMILGAIRVSNETAG